MGATVTELLLAEGWVEKYPLYHFAWKKGTESVDPGSYMDEQYVNIKISFSVEDEKKAIAAMRCYITQYTEEEMKEEAERKQKDMDNMIMFRRFAVAKGLKNDFE